MENMVTRIGETTPGGSYLDPRVGEGGRRICTSTSVPGRTSKKDSRKWRLLLPLVVSPPEGRSKRGEREVGVGKGRGESGKPLFLSGTFQCLPRPHVRPGKVCRLPLSDPESSKVGDPIPSRETHLPCTLLPTRVMTTIDVTPTPFSPLSCSPFFLRTPSSRPEGKLKSRVKNKWRFREDDFGEFQLGSWFTLPPRHPSVPGSFSLVRTSDKNSLRVLPASV